MKSISLLPATQAKITEGKRLTKFDMACEIGRRDVHHACYLYWDKLPRTDVAEAFNKLFNTSIQ